MPSRPRPIIIPGPSGFGLDSSETTFSTESLSRSFLDALKFRTEQNQLQQQREQEAQKAQILGGQLGIDPSVVQAIGTDNAGSLFANLAKLQQEQQIEQQAAAQEQQGIQDRGEAIEEVVFGGMTPQQIQANPLLSALNRVEDTGTRRELLAGDAVTDALKGLGKPSQGQRKFPPSRKRTEVDEETGQRFDVTDTINDDGTITSTRIPAKPNIRVIENVVDPSDPEGRPSAGVIDLDKMASLQSRGQSAEEARINSTTFLTKRDGTNVRKLSEKETREIQQSQKQSDDFVNALDSLILRLERDPTLVSPTGLGRRFFEKIPGFFGVENLPATNFKKDLEIIRTRLTPEILKETRNIAVAERKLVEDIISGTAFLDTAGEVKDALRAFKKVVQENKLLFSDQFKELKAGKGKIPEGSLEFQEKLRALQKEEEEIKRRIQSRKAGQ